MQCKLYCKRVGRGYTDGGYASKVLASTAAPTCSMTFRVVIGQRGTISVISLVSYIWFLLLSIWEYEYNILSLHSQVAWHALHA